MKVSELIAKLEEYKAFCGDVDVVVSSGMCVRFNTAQSAAGPEHIVDLAHDSVTVSNIMGKTPLIVIDIDFAFHEPSVVDASVNPYPLSGGFSR